VKAKKFWNRKKANEEIEHVYGDAALKLIYGNRLGQLFANQILSKKIFSRLLGKYQSSSQSKHKIEAFIKEYNIGMEEYLPGPYASFNDFFIRQFKPGIRPFYQGTDGLPAFAEARYFAYDQVSTEQKFPIKGTNLSAAELLGDVGKARPFVGGPLLLARLCPTDYHRFHFPDSGKEIESYYKHGKLHSVNPLALKSKEDILITNERHVSLLETENFGKLAYIEVGALCVGKIIQTHPYCSPFKRGDEKGYFLFGGSTVIVLGEPGRWKPDADLVEKTSHGQETLVCLGEKVAARI
jgi:phosphatidylserine decarboxylase